MRKKAKVVMLPTKEGIIHKPKDRDSNFHLSEMPVKESLGYLPQHLYITSDDEIKEGDWFFDLQNNIHKCLEVDSNGNYRYNRVNRISKGKGKKIIATTDKSLKIGELCGNCDNGKVVCSTTKSRFQDCGCIKSLPSLSQEFIQEYCKRNGEIEDVEVEYEKKDIEPFPDNWKENYVKWGIKHQPKIVELLKINQDNTINIYILEEEKLYTKNDVIDIIKKYEEDTLYFGRDSYYKNINIPDNWIKENL